MSNSKFVDSWLRHRLVTVELVDMIGEGGLNFKPWDGAMTLSELVLHIMSSGFQFTNAVKLGTIGKPADKPLISSMADLRKYVHEITESTKATMASITDEEMESLVDASKVMGTSLPGKALLATMRDHEIHHKGQLFVYARMAGVQNPPFFVKHSV
jgi:uncharacterized damage-inducible protein DinB